VEPQEDYILLTHLLNTSTSYTDMIDDIHVN